MMVEGRDSIETLTASSIPAEVNRALENGVRPPLHPSRVRAVSFNDASSVSKQSRHISNVSLSTRAPDTSAQEHQHKQAELLNLPPPICEYDSLTQNVWESSYDSGTKADSVNGKHEETGDANSPSTSGTVSPLHTPILPRSPQYSPPAHDLDSHMRTHNGKAALDHSRHGMRTFCGLSVSPQILEFFGTLFPTLLRFRQKSLKEKLVSVLAVPSVFILTITLPVIENSAEIVASPSSPFITVSHEEGDENDNYDFAEIPPHMPPSELDKNEVTKIGWNRWLLGVQCVMSPQIMTILLFYDQAILFPLLYALLCGLIGLASLLIFTVPDKAPRFHTFFCAWGFLVSIIWISSIANEVVGVLKAIGAIFAISDAILGLTVFAVGNSLGDLISNVTIARMGYPMMALSACYGGPMLNILLGIGASGIYMIATHRYEAYAIDVSPVLVVSAATLFASLLYQIIAVPLHGFQMTKGIGWTLIGLWIVGTSINLILEVVGI